MFNDGFNFYYAKNDNVCNTFSSIQDFQLLGINREYLEMPKGAKLSCFVWVFLHRFALM